MTAQCAECERLKLERQRLKFIHEMATLTSNAAAASSDIANFVRLKKLADEARLDAELANLELEQHQRVHHEGQLSSPL